MIIHVLGELRSWYTCVFELEINIKEVPQGAPGQSSSAQERLLPL